MNDRRAASGNKSDRNLNTPKDRDLDAARQRARLGPHVVMTFPDELTMQCWRQDLHTEGMIAGQRYLAGAIGSRMEDATGEQWDRLVVGLGSLTEDVAAGRRPAGVLENVLRDFLGLPPIDTGEGPPAVLG